MTESGFAIPALSAQRVFRTVLSALAEPGRILALDPSCVPPRAVDPAAAAIILALCDADTPLWLSPAIAQAADFFRFHAGAPIVSAASDALFLLAPSLERPSLATLRAGTPDYPDHSATMILAVDRLCDHGWRLSGPGIADTREFLPQPLDDGFAAEWQHNHAAYPLGIDVIFVARDRVAALPRSTRLEA